MCVTVWEGVESQRDGPVMFRATAQRYRRQVPKDEHRLVREMIKLAEQYGRDGYRRVMELRRRRRWRVNHKRIARSSICC